MASAHKRAERDFEAGAKPSYNTPGGAATGPYLGHAWPATVQRARSSCLRSSAFRTGVLGWHDEEGATTRGAHPVSTRGHRFSRSLPCSARAFLSSTSLTERHSAATIAVYLSELCLLSAFCGQ